MNYEGRWLGIFQPDRREFAILGKMTKGKLPKVGLKRWNLKAVGKERLEISSLGPLRTRKPAKGFWRGNLKRGK